MADDKKTRYEEFVNNLPDRSQRFLALVKERGTVTIGEAMKALDVSVGKAMGGITGSIGRWAPARGLDVPYEVIKVDGERAYKWLGLEYT